VNQQDYLTYGEEFLQEWKAGTWLQKRLRDRFAP
jgi:hypothetical protein